ncbi:hypothetical protein EDC94DRAFT_646414 [Helicostylum pulchrum]|nr:hypothetical protein EDC94DRAFT_646414 [Helicostylum pulchrum]
MILLKHFIFQNGQNLPVALYIKQQLRNDKQELIPEEALSLCTKSDITLRPISLRIIIFLMTMASRLPPAMILIAIKLNSFFMRTFLMTLRFEESTRLDLGREFRAQKVWNKDLYFLNKRLHNQYIPSGLLPNFSLSNDTLQKLKHNKALVQEEPDIQHDPNKSYVYDFTAAKVNDAVLSMSHIFKRKQGYVVTFIGNWSINVSYIRGNNQRSSDTILQKFSSVESDITFTVDEIRSTVTCSSCFEVTAKQIVRVGENEKRRVKGVVTCTNNKCPSRLFCSSCTVSTTLSRTMARLYRL